MSETAQIIYAIICGAVILAEVFVLIIVTINWIKERSKE